MRPALTTLALLLLLTAPVSAHSADRAPDWSLPASNGKTIHLRDEVGQQTTVLFFWATWCPYCKALMPHLHSMRLEYGENVKILAINFREDGDPVAFIESAGYDFTVLPDGDAVAASYGIHGTPGVIIVDSEQKIRFDLHRLPRRDPPPRLEKGGHRKMAAYRAPYWAAEIRKSIDAVLADVQQ